MSGRLRTFALISVGAFAGVAVSLGISAYAFRDSRGPIPLEEISLDTLETREPTGIKGHIARARRIEKFLSQPFIVAEAFTNKAGKVTPLAETIRSFEELCDGKHDALPEGAFMYVGPIEQAEEQAKKLTQ